MSTVKAIFLSIITFFSPIQHILLLVGALIILDTVTGILAAKKRGEKITSKKMGAVVSKFIVYHLAILTLYILDVALINEFTMEYVKLSIQYVSTKLAGLTIAFIELTSVRENVETIFNININRKFKKMVVGIKKLIETIRNVKDGNK